MQTPHRFRSKRQLWTYSGLGIETRDSAQYRFVRGQLQHPKKPQQIRGLNQNHNDEMKEQIMQAKAPDVTLQADDILFVPRSASKSSMQKIEIYYDVAPSAPMQDAAPIFIR